MRVPLCASVVSRVECGLTQSQIIFLKEAELMGEKPDLKYGPEGIIESARSEERESHEVRELDVAEAYGAAKKAKEAIGKKARESYERAKEKAKRAKEKVTQIAMEKAAEIAKKKGMEKWLPAEPSKSCAAFYGIPESPELCPTSLIEGVGLSNYYMQFSLHEAYEKEYVWPNALYAADANGGLELEPVARVFLCRFQRPAL